MPLQLTDEWRLIVRPVFSIVDYEVPEGIGNWNKEFGLGDTVLLTAFTTAPADSKWLWGAGPTWLFPTATDDALGSEKWSVGPAVTVFYLGEKWILGGVLQNWFSFAGDGGRESVNLMDLQYVIQYRVTPTFQVGMTPNIQYDWADKTWDVPVAMFMHRQRVRVVLIFQNRYRQAVLVLLSVMERDSVRCFGRIFSAHKHASQMRVIFHEVNDLFAPTAEHRRSKKWVRG